MLLWELMFWGTAGAAAFAFSPSWLPGIANFGASAVAFTQLASMTAPVRMALALSTIPWIDSNLASLRKHRQNAPPAPRHGWFGCANSVGNAP